MPRRVFFSFHYQRDIMRVNQVRMSNQFIGVPAAGWADASLWEEAKKKGDATIKKMIDDALHNTSTTVVCIGAATAGRRYINYEIEKSLARGNGILGLRIHHLIAPRIGADVAGEVPEKLKAIKAPIYSFTTAADLGLWVEKAAIAAGR